MTIPTPIEGTAITAQWGAAVAAALNSIRQENTSTVLGGPVSAITSLGSLTVPALDYDTIQIASMHFVGNFSTAGDRFLAEIRAGGIGGTVRGTSQLTVPTGVGRHTFVIPDTPRLGIAAGNTQQWTATVQRVTGTGTVAQQSPGSLCVLVLPTP